MAKKQAAESAEAKPDAAPEAAAEKSEKPAKEKKLSAIDAAAQVLAASKEPMNAKEMIEAMASKGLWTSPSGQTPWATLYTVVT